MLISKRSELSSFGPVRSNPLLPALQSPRSPDNCSADSRRRAPDPSACSRPGLNCFEPDQEHAAHTHAGQDKLYVILTGDAEVQIAEESALLSAGDAAFAPSGVVHSIRNVSGSERLIVMAVLAPPPRK